MSSFVSALAERIRSSIAIEKLQPTDLILKIGNANLLLLPERPTAVRQLAYKKLHVYPFKDVPICWRRAYEESCLWELLLKLESAVKPFSDLSENNSKAVVENAKELEIVDSCKDVVVELCDRAIIFSGAPGRRELIDKTLDSVDQEQRPWTNQCMYETYSKLDSLDGSRLRKRRRISEDEDIFPVHNRSSEENKRSNLMPDVFPAPRLTLVPLIDLAVEIPRVKAPSMTQFEKNMFEEAKPLILTHTIDHWPASKLWKQPKYWYSRTVAGRRLVPIELGKTYVDEGWGQRIVPFRQFMFDHLLQDQSLITSNDASQGSASQDSRDIEKNEQPRQNLDRISPHSEGAVGYLAQHDLLDQIPSLRNDIAIPDYCYIDTPESMVFNIRRDVELDPHHNLSNEDVVNPSDVMLNIWLGPGGTISPAHTDPHHNILAQVFGRKYVRLFAPSETAKLYPMSDKEGTQGVNMGNTSSVDVGRYLTLDSSDLATEELQASLKAPDTDCQREKFPDHESAPFVEAILEPGECLYIPRGWWHYVRSLEPSCNVSFWWD